MRRARLRSIHRVGSKSFSSQAKVVAYPSAGKAVMGAAPERPSIRFFQLVSTSFPRGVTPPIPVITTLRRPFMLIWLNS
jgi:hypothetical protein